MPNQPKTGTTRLEITLPGDLKDAARAEAARRGESVSEAVRRFLTEYVGERKDSPGGLRVSRHPASVGGMNTATVNIKGRTYRFTTEGAEEREAVSTIGSLVNSRGRFAGYVVRLNSTGTLSLVGGPKCTAREERAGLAALTDAGH